MQPLPPLPSPRRLRFSVRYHRVVTVWVRGVYGVCLLAMVIALWQSWPGPVPIRHEDGSVTQIGFAWLALGLSAFFAVLIGGIELIGWMARRELQRLLDRARAEEAPPPHARGGRAGRGERG
jgi:hypothetical protein